MSISIDYFKLKPEFVINSFLIKPGMKIKKEFKYFLVTKDLYTYYLILKNYLKYPYLIFENIYYWFKKAPDGYPIPPSKLIFLVVGNISPKSYLNEGQYVISNMISLLKNCSIDIHNFKRILDFGCGSGRLIRHLHSLNGVELFGTDYNKKLIYWCKKNLPFARFKLNNLSPPIDFNDNIFDFIYSRSIFTHLDESLQKKWMGEFHRILDKNGILLFSTHGDFFIDILTENELREYKSGKLIFKGTEYKGSNYSASFQNNKHVIDKLLSGFNLLSYIPGKSNFKQDIYILKKVID